MADSLLIECRLDGAPLRIADRDTQRGSRVLRYVPASELDAARARIAELEADMAVYNNDRCALAADAERERELRESTQEDVDSLNAVVERQGKRIAELEDWRRRAIELINDDDPCDCDDCWWCTGRRQLLSEVQP